MKVRCRHCGSLNPTDVVDDQGNGTCSVCGRSLGVEPAAQGDQSARAPSEILNSGATFDPIDWSRETYDIKQEDGAVRTDSVTGSRELLGSLPTDDEAIDISELLEGTSASIDPDETRPEMDDSVITTFPVNQPTDDVSAGWRIKNPRGVVYEMGSATDVVSWLANLTDFSSVWVSRGAGAFRPVSDFPELSDASEVSGTEPTGSLDGSMGADSVSDLSDLLVDMNPGSLIEEAAINAPQPSSGAELELDFARASTRHGVGSTVLQRNTAVSATPDQVSAVVPDSSAYGFRTLLLILILLFGATHVVLNLAFTEKQRAAVSITDVPPGPRLQHAIKLLDDKKYTAATQVLERLSKRSNDPRVFQHLATALYKTDRVQEAEVALETYRKRRDSRGKKK